MKASELIENLAELTDRFGDCEVIAGTEWETYFDEETSQFEKVKGINPVLSVEVKENKSITRIFVLR